MMNIREARTIADTIYGQTLVDDISGQPRGQYYRPRTLRRAFARLQFACDNPTPATSETGWLADNKRALAIWDNAR